MDGLVPMPHEPPQAQQIPHPRVKLFPESGSSSRLVVVDVCRTPEKRPPCHLGPTPLRSGNEKRLSRSSVKTIPGHRLDRARTPLRSTHFAAAGRQVTIRMTTFGPLPTIAGHILEDLHDRHTRFGPKQ